MPRSLFPVVCLAALCLAVSPARASAAATDGEAPDMVSGPPVWGREEIRLFCAGRKAAIGQDLRSCMKTHKDKQGRRMDPADRQELAEYQRRHAGRLKRQRGAVRSVKKDSGMTHNGMMRLRKDTVPPPQAAMEPPLMPPGMELAPQEMLRTLRPD